MKKAIVYSLIVGLLLNSFIAYSNVKGDFEHLDGEIDLEFEFVFDEPLINNIVLDGEVYDKVTLSNLPSIHRVNKPILPMKPVSILLPQKTMYRDIEVVASEKVLLGEGYKIELGKEPIPISSDLGDIEREIITCIETNGDNSDFDVFPEKLYSNVGVHYLRGYSILKVNLYPVFYEIKNGGLYYFKKLVLKVNLEECDNINQLCRDISKDKDTVATTVENPQMLETYSNTIKKTGYGSPLVSTLDQYDYVIITSERLKSAVGDYTFQSLIDYKIFKGLSATIVTVEDIISDSSYWNSNSLFNDTQAQIRNFITDAYMNWNTEYILLAADSDIIPPRELFFHYRDMFNDIDELIPSDLYYSCLDGNYNSNENIRWGEPKDGDTGGDVDLVGEIYVGRAPVDNWEDVSNFVRKTISYEQTQNPYITDVLMCGEYLGSDEWGGDAKDVIAGILNMQYLLDDYNILKLYDRDWPGQDWPKSELIDIINDDIHFINHLGHSNYQYAMKMDNPDIGSLTNNEYFFVYSQGCKCGGFDRDDCFGEELIKSPNGAFATVMNTRSGWYYSGEINGPSQKFDKKFFKAIIDEGITQIGKANQKAKEKLISQINDEEILRYIGAQQKHPKRL